MWVAIILAFECRHWIRTAWHFPCLCTTAASWASQVPPGHTWNSWCQESDPPGECQDCAVWVALALCSFCLNTRIASWGLWPGWKITDAESQSSWDPINSGPLTWADLETQPLPAEKSLKWVFHWTQGKFLWLRVCESIQNIIVYYCDCNIKFYNHSVNAKLTSDW